MKTLVAFYFSGTGNTLYIAEYLCKKLSSAYNCELCDITDTENYREKAVRADALMFAFPIYGSAPPIPMRNFVHACGGLLCGKNVIIAETQYFFSGDGAASLGRTIKKYGGIIIGAETFNMPNNLADCKIFAVKNGGETQKTLAKAKKRADRFAAKLLKGNARRRGFCALSHGVGYFSQRKFWMRNETAKRDKMKIYPERCVGCGLCAKSCPVKNIEMRGGRPVPAGNCVMCYRCVNLCPKKAITVLGSAPPEKQYFGPKR